MNDAIKSVVIPNWIYLEFWISALLSLSIFVVIAIKHMKFTSRGGPLINKYILGSIFSALIGVPAIVSYNIITQFDIYPQYVKYFEMDFSRLKDNKDATK